MNSVQPLQTGPHFRNRTIKAKLTEGTAYRQPVIHLDLKPGQLAFRQKKEVNSHAAKAGFNPGDVIVGVDDLEPEMSMTDFLFLVRRTYLVGDQVNVHILRDGKRLKVPMKLIQ